MPAAIARARFTSPGIVLIQSTGSLAKGRGAMVRALLDFKAS